MASRSWGACVVPKPLSNCTAPWGSKSSAFRVLPSRLPLQLKVLPEATRSGCRNC